MDGFYANARTVQDLLRAIEIGLPEIDIAKGTIVESLEDTTFDPSTAKTLVEALQSWAKKEPDRPHVYLRDEKGREIIITFKKLLEQARWVANGLYDQGVRMHDTVAIMLPTGEAFFYSFMGVQLLGAIPVPIYPPFRPDQIEEYALREVKILKKAHVKVMITFDKAEKLSALLSVFIDSLKCVTTHDKLINLKKNAPLAKVKESDPAMIQFTSGSTSDPKGVLLLHQNLLANIRAMGVAVNVQPNDVIVSWLPLYHDMGLIGCWLSCLYYARPLVVMSPLIFLTRPERWLWAIHYHRGTISAGPNFAYELCLKRINPEDLKGLDLSSWRLAFNGAEAVNPNTILNFIDKFKTFGFKRESMYPVYGLAETCVGLSFPELNRGPLIDKIEIYDYEKLQKATPIEDPKQKHLKFVCCGKPIPHHEFRIVDENHQPLPERHIGNLQFKGPSTMQGYFNNPKATRAAFDGEWCNTGDLAYLVEGELYVTGRKKDLIIKAGRNIFPEVIEEVTTQVPGIRKGCVIAFGVNDEKTGTEKLIIVAESKERNRVKKRELHSTIIERVTVAVGLPPDEVILVGPHTVPKTSSGKLQRAQCKQLYLKGKLTGFKIPLWLQLSKLFFKGGALKAVSFLGLIARFILTLFVWIVIALLTLPIWLMALILPKEKSRSITRGMAKFLLFIAGIRLKYKKRDFQKLMPDKPMILVVNHASYVDAFILYAFLPNHFSFISKKELFSVPLVKTLLMAHQHLPVDRDDYMQSLEDTRNITKFLQNGRSLVIFPEGTFAYAKGLRPFKSGAFKVSVESGVDVCPMAIAGTRNILPAHEWLLKPGKVKIKVGDCITPQENSWAEITRLHSKARAFIAEHCGESIIEL